MVRVVHTAISGFESMCGRGAVTNQSENNINDINVLEFYHVIRWNLCLLWSIRRLIPCKRCMLCSLFESTASQLLDASVAAGPPTGLSRLGACTRT